MVAVVFIMLNNKLRNSLPVKKNDLLTNLFQDGQADAMFLDSGNVNKASMDPYNLKSIIAETFSSHKGKF